MKIVDRNTFMSLPAGTLYIKGSPHAYHAPICVKGESLPNDDPTLQGDWFHRDLSEVDAHNSDQQMRRMDAMLYRGESFPLSDGIGRDGCFDPDDTFLIYEEEDLREVIKVCNTAIETEQAWKARFQG